MMTAPIQLIGISGSLRAKSYNTMLLNALPELLPEGVVLETLAIAALPVYNEDVDIPAALQRPATVNNFRSALAKADGLVIVSPEYNYSIPGGLKNAIDWASRGEDSPIRKKPVALMGVSTGMWGTVRMQLAFEPVFFTLDIKMVKPEILIANAASKFDEAGRLADEATKQMISKQLLAIKKILTQ